MRVQKGDVPSMCAMEKWPEVGYPFIMHFLK